MLDICDFGLINSFLFLNLRGAPIIALGNPFKMHLILNRINNIKLT